MAPNIFILATAKTGSTLVYYSVKASAEKKYGQYNGVFEPKTDVEVLEKFRQPCIVKMLYERYSKHPDEFLARFEKKIAVIRDPRDTIVSRMLYQAQDFFDKDSTAVVAKISALLKEKERNPAGKTICEIYSEIGQLINKQFVADKAADTAISVINALMHNFFIIKYEDIIRGEWSRLSDYAGFPVEAADVEQTRHRRVIRSATTGDWRKWFTRSDVEYFRPKLSSALVAAGYEDEWELDHNRPIDPETGSAYVEKLFRLKFPLNG